MTASLDATCRAALPDLDWSHSVTHRAEGRTVAGDRITVFGDPAGEADRVLMFVDFRVDGDVNVRAPGPTWYPSRRQALEAARELLAQRHELCTRALQQALVQLARTAPADEPADDLATP